MATPAIRTDTVVGEQKEILFCLGSDHEVRELYGFICDLSRKGHKVRVIVEGIQPPTFRDNSIEVYSEKILDTPAIGGMQIAVLVVGHQCDFGKHLAVIRSETPFRVLYQGRYHDATPWTKFHKSLTHVWGYDDASVAGWNDLEHDPWIINGREDDFNFFQQLVEMLEDD